MNFKRRIMSFKYAFAGLSELWQKEKNTRIHLFFTIIVIIFSFLLKVSAAEFCILILTISAVWGAEAMNSSVERVVDLITLEKHPLAKAAKDLAAGSVLLFAIGSVIIGVVIFLPKIISLFVY